MYVENFCRANVLGSFSMSRQAEYKLGLIFDTVYQPYGN